jgi:RNA polymerase sigma-B factor
LVLRGRFGVGTDFVTARGAESLSTAMLLSAYHRRGDRAARDRVIVENLPLVHALARRFSRAPEQVDDLVQAGAIGLIKAVDGFEETRGADLGAYAVPTIVGELRRSVDDQAWPVRVPRGAEAGRRVAVALDEDDFEAPGAEAELGRSEERELLRAGFRVLSRRERRVVVLRYYRDWSQRRIAEELGLSQAHVSRILASALQKMRGALVQPAPEALCDSSPVTTISGR